MIEELIAASRFKEALELLTDDSEENRYYRLLCLSGLGEYRKAKPLAQIALDKAETTYYDVVAEYLTILKELEEYDEAIDLVVKELSMPYIPYQYETVFNTVYDELILAKQEANYDVNYDKPAAFSEEEMENILIKENSNPELLEILLEQIDRINVRRLLRAIQIFLNNPDRPPFAKTILMEAMINQQIDEEMTVRKSGQVYDFNPSYFSLVLEQDAAVTISEYLSGNIESDNPVLFEQCNELLIIYLYSIYPQYIDETEYLEIAAAIHYYLATLQYIDLDLKEIEIVYNVDKEQVEKRIEDIESKLSTFG